LRGRRQGSCSGHHLLADSTHSGPRPPQLPLPTAAPPGREARAVQQPERHERAHAVPDQDCLAPAVALHRVLDAPRDDVKLPRLLQRLQREAPGGVCVCVWVACVWRVCGV
jgi:hypothetical protein